MITHYFYHSSVSDEARANIIDPKVQREPIAMSLIPNTNILYCHVPIKRSSDQYEFSYEMTLHHMQPQFEHRHKPITWEMLAKTGYNLFDNADKLAGHKQVDKEFRMKYYTKFYVQRCLEMNVEFYRNLASYCKEHVKMNDKNLSLNLIIKAQDMYRLGTM